MLRRLLLLPALLAGALLLLPAGAAHAGSGPIDTIITTSPPGKFETRPQIGARATQDVAEFECQLDGWAAMDCGIAYSTTDINLWTVPTLNQGTHTVKIRACYEDDSIGDEVCDPTPATQTFQTVTEGPTATFTGQSTPNGARVKTQPEYHPAGGAQYECSVDSTTLGACPVLPIRPNINGGLAQGEHTVRVRAREAGGPWGPVVSRTFIWDNQGPQFNLGSPLTTNDATPTLTWSAPADGGGAYTVTCKIDSTNVPCEGGTAQITTPLEDGTHVLEVHGTDGMGNTSFATRFVTVDTLAPVVSDLRYSAATGEVTWTANEFGDGSCAIDGTAAVECFSPFRPVVGPGEHTLQLALEDVAGNVAYESVSFTVAGDQDVPRGTPDPPVTNPGPGVTPPAPVVTPAPPVTTTRASTATAKMTTCATTKKKAAKKPKRAKRKARASACKPAAKTTKKKPRKKRSAKKR